tara:strand:+ start:166 stop:354 length:189 start_codon:yes stop_codon:yes gene_type:complete
VKVAVYVVPEPVKLESVPPPVTVTSEDVKSLVNSLDVNVKFMLASFFKVKRLTPAAVTKPKG